MTEFFSYNEYMSFIGIDGLRVDIPIKEYNSAKKQAEEQFSLMEFVIPTAIKDILNIKLSEIEQINLEAAKMFPNDQRLFGLMVRRLSSDIPSAKLTDGENLELDKAINLIKSGNANKMSSAPFRAQRV